jgi:putative spermidine/putrescine transport system permease protein
MPGVIAGALIVFTLSVSAYVTPSILSGGRQNTTSILIFQQYASILDFHFGGALAVVLLVTTIILVSVSLIGANRRQQVAS